MGDVLWAGVHWFLQFLRAEDHIGAGQRRLGARLLRADQFVLAGVLYVDGR
jgi:hypothetical protein